MNKYTMVDRTICIPCGACSIGSEIYKEDEEGVAYVLLDNNKGNKNVPKEFHEEVEDAKLGCPTDAIKVSEYPFNGDPDKFEPIEMKNDENELT